MLKRKGEAISPLFDPGPHVAIRHAGAIAHRSSAPSPYCASRAAISGDDCIRVLEQFGLIQYERRPGATWMECGATFVLVPACDKVPIETLEDLLDAAGVSMKDFLERLDALSLGRIVA
jgi:hypothetical protein